MNPPKSHRRVAFSEPKERGVHESDIVLVKEKCASTVDNGYEPDYEGFENSEVSEPSIWYQDDEIETFRQEAASNANVIQDHEREMQRPARMVWSRNLWNAYSGFGEARLAYEMNSIMDTVTAIHPMCVGLEKWIREILETNMNNRNEFYDAVAFAQEQGTSDRTLRRICREHSRSSRLFAHFLACCIHED